MPATLAKSGGLFLAMIIALFGMAQAQDTAFAVHMGIIIVDVQQDIFHGVPIRKTDYRPASIPMPFLRRCLVQGFTHDSGVSRFRGAFRQPMNGVTGGA